MKGSYEDDSLECEVCEPGYFLAEDKKCILKSDKDKNCFKVADSEKP